MTSSTGTRPATAGSSRSTSPRRASACPQPVKLRPARRSTPARRARPQPTPRSSTRSPGEITFRTTQPLGPYEGLTVAVAFPKGVVAEPPTASRARLVAGRLRPAAGRRCSACSACSLSIIVAWQRAGRDPRAGTVVPLFSPPDDLSPAGMRYVDEDGRRQPRLRRRAGRHGRPRPHPHGRGGRRLALADKTAARAAAPAPTPLPAEEEAALDALCRARRIDRDGAEEPREILGCQEELEREF